MMRKPKTFRRHSWDPTETVTVYLEKPAEEWRTRDLDVYLTAEGGEPIGTITPHATQSERKISGTRLVSRGATFTAWAAREAGGDRFDYFMQHRSQADAIRVLLSRAERKAG